MGRVNGDGSNRQSTFIDDGPGSAETCGVAVDDEHVYWAEGHDGHVGRAERDGDDPDPDLVSGLGHVCGVDVDDDHVFWVTTYRQFGGTIVPESGEIGRAGLDGSDPQTDFIDGLEQPCGVAVDDTYVYWGTREGPIGRATLDGEEVQVDWLEGSGGACDLAVDDSHVYWSSGGGIGRAAIDGTDVEPEYIEGLDRTCGVAVHDGRIYWSRYAIGDDGSVGSAELDGDDARTIVSGPGVSCGVAVDEHHVPDKVPYYPPPPPCEILHVSHLPRQPVAFVWLRMAYPGNFRVENQALSWRVVNEGPERIVKGNWAWKIRIAPQVRGAVGQKVRLLLRNRNRLVQMLRLTCEPAPAIGEPAFTQRRLVLKRRPVSERRPMVVRRASRHHFRRRR